MSTSPRISTPRVIYEATRLRFKASVIEPLLPDDAFRIITPLWDFQMTKRDFYLDFDNVVASASYRDKGDYNYKTLPSRVLKYLIAG